MRLAGLERWKRACIRRGQLFRLCRRSRAGVVRKWFAHVSASRKEIYLHFGRAIVARGFGVSREVVNLRRCVAYEWY